MSDATNNREQLTKILKLALIPLLSLALLGVVFWPDEHDSSELFETVSLNEQGDASLQEGSLAADKHNAEAKTIIWPETNLQEIIDNNPFRWSKELRKDTPALHVGLDTRYEGNDMEATARRTSLENQIEAIRLKTVSAVFHSNKGAAAIIGSDVVHVGDLLEEGIRIVEINSDGVKVQIDESYFQVILP